MKKIFLFNLFLFFVFFPLIVSAQGDSVGFTITPPLININLIKGQEISTIIKVVNNNSKPLKIYVEAVDFKDQGNGPEFLDRQSVENEPGTENIYLSNWITLAKTELDLLPFRSGDIPFVISVPKNANPGGHYAALLIGTNPPNEPGSGSVVKISSKVSSLILARVAGDIEEKGMIREFLAANKISGKAETEFLVRFQNLGNVHLQPRGTIKVFDMFGKQKGNVLDFNITKDAGNVLPGSERSSWGDNLRWKDENFFLFNRYKGELSVSFGQDVKQTDSRYLYFWVVNWKWLIISIVSLLIFLILLLVIVKIYVRQSVKSLQKEIGFVEQRTINKPAVKLPSRKKVVRKKTEIKNKKIVDLRKK